MSVQETYLKEIADAIRAKENSAARIPAKSFASRILALKGASDDSLCKISLAVSDQNGGTVSGGGTCSRGMSVNIAAANKDTHKFLGWQENGILVTEQANYTLDVTKDRSLTALFEENKERLPDGYIEVEYISNPNLGYIIDTASYIFNTLSNSNMDIRMKIGIDAVPTADKIIGGNRFYRNNTSITSDCNLLLCTASGEIQYQYGHNTSGSTAKYTISLPFKPGIVEIRLCTSNLEENRVFSVNGKAYENMVYNVSISRSTKHYSNLFAGRYGYNTYSGNKTSDDKWTDGNLPLDYKLYSYRNRDREFVPCINPSGLVGLYCLANNQFYSSAVTSKPFVAGPKLY